jgi:DNA replication and repair protein RecF
MNGEPREVPIRDPSKIIEMVNNSDFGQLFISDTHPERTESIIKSTHQSYKIFNL